MLISITLGCSSGPDAIDSERFAHADAPLDAYFDDSGSLDQALVEWQGLVEVEIAECMKRNGFTYHPARSILAPQDFDAMDGTEREWTDTYGYGVVSAALAFASLDTDEDPNIIEASKLSARGQEQYMVALMGQVVGSSPETAHVPLEERGCIGTGVIERGGQRVSDGLSTLQTARGLGLERIRLQASVLQAEADWAGCMAAAGYGFGTRADARGHVERQAKTIGDEFAVAVNDGAAWSGALDGHPDFPQSEFDALQAEELRIAGTDLDCWDAHVAGIWNPKVHQLELELLADLSTPLSHVKAALDTAG